jgi:voltage-gated sodium channel
MIQCIFSVFFSTEIVLRICAHGIEFWYGDEWHWNYFDLCIVIVGVTDTIGTLLTSDSGSDESSSTSGLRTLRLIRITRLLRVLRVARIMHFVRALRDLLVSIFHTLRFLAWTLALLFIIVYVFAILFTQATADYLVLHPGADNGLCGDSHSEIARQFGSLPASMDTLYLSITGGLDWGEAAASLGTVGLAWQGIFIFYISFCIFAVLNVVTSVFCQSAIENGQNDLDAIIHKQITQKMQVSEKMEKLFAALDTDNSGSVSVATFKARFQNGMLQSILEGLGIQYFEGQGQGDCLFTLLDADGSG